MKIEHLAIWVKDLDKMKDFYVQYFNAKPGNKYHNPSKNFTSYFLSFDEGCRLELMHKPAIAEIQNGEENEYIGVTHFAISLGSKATVDQMTNTLRADGYTIVGGPRTTGDGYYESVVLDPEQNRIELTV